MYSRWTQWLNHMVTSQCSRLHTKQKNECCIEQWCSKCTDDPQMHGNWGCKVRSTMEFNLASFPEQCYLQRIVKFILTLCTQNTNFSSRSNKARLNELLMMCFLTYVNEHTKRNSVVCRSFWLHAFVNGQKLYVKNVIIIPDKLSTSQFYMNMPNA